MRVLLTCSGGAGPTCNPQTIEQRCMVVFIQGSIPQQRVWCGVCVLVWPGA